jgi:prephenate dehydratase
LAGNADTALIPVEDMVETYLLLDQAGLFINKAYGLGGRSRLLLVGTEFTLVEEASRLSLLLSVSESKGVLAWVLSILADCGLTAARLECLAGSIFLELLARPEEEEILRVLYQLEKECGELRLLGWYSVESLA